MRREDEQRLDLPYDPGGYLGEVLGVAAPNVLELQRAVLADLDEHVLGVRWWAPSLDAQRRILIGDHLLRCVSSVSQNLVEAQLHLLEALDWQEREDNRYADMVQVEYPERGQPQAVVRPPAVTTAAHDLPAAMLGMHRAGVLRAAGSTLDCLASVIVGVVGLPTPIVRADFDALRRMKIDDLDELQRSFLGWLHDELLPESETTWLRWLLHYRNTLVHRARPLATLLPVPRGSRPLLDALGRPIVRVRIVEVLPANPQLTDMQALVLSTTDGSAWALGHRGGEERTLTEPAQDTLAEAVRRLAGIADEVCHRLLSVWSKRREEPSSVPQPARQWPNMEAATVGFAGFFAGRTDVRMDFAHTSFEMAQRMRAASLFDGTRDGVWKSHDEVDGRGD